MKEEQEKKWSSFCLPRRSWRRRDVSCTLFS